MMILRVLLAALLALSFASGGWGEQEFSGTRVAPAAAPQNSPSPPAGPAAEKPERKEAPQGLAIVPTLLPAVVAASPLKGTDHLWEDVKKSGAKGDGKTDDTKAIQKAIDAAAKGAKVVLVPPGVYLTSGSGLTIATSDMTFRGLGYSTIIKHSGNQPALTVGLGKKPACQNVKLADFQLQGNEAAKDGILLGDYTIRYYIENVCVSSFSRGAGIKAVDHNHSGHISQVQLTGNAIGISIGDHGQYTDISFSKIHHNSKYGVELTDCNVINIFSTQIEKNGDAGGASVLARGVAALNLIGCYNEQNAAFPGPFLILTKSLIHDCTGINLIGCRSIGNKEAPNSIVLESAENVNFTGNVFSSFTSGIFVLRPSGPNLVKNITGQSNFLKGPLGKDIFSLK
jgi:hypothetical protein